MTLSKIDIENIEKLFNTEELILNVYNELIQLEIDNKNTEIKSKYDYLETLFLIETNMFDEFDNIDKYQLIIEYIDSHYKNKSPIIVERISNKLNSIMLNYKYSELINKKELSIDEIFERGKVENTQIRKFISDDINRIFKAYLINYIKYTDNKEIRNCLIQYKYFNTFSNIDNNNSIIANNTDVFLSYNALFQILKSKRQIPDFLLDQLLSERINSLLNILVNDLINIPDKDLFDSNQLTQAYVISFYIKACLLFVEENAINDLKKDIDENVNNSISKQILIGTIDEMTNDKNKPKIYYVSFYR